MKITYGVIAGAFAIATISSLSSNPSDKQLTMKCGDGTEMNAPPAGATGPMAVRSIAMIQDCRNRR